MTTLLDKATFVNSPKAIRRVTGYLTSMSHFISHNKHQYRLLLDMKDSMELLMADIEHDMFGKPDQLLMSPAQFQSFSKLFEKKDDE